METPPHQAEFLFPFGAYRPLPARGARNAATLLAATLAFAALPARADSPYEGKTITIITSTGVGGVYDLTARVIARHMGRYIPGNPTLIVQNMPGGGNVLATNYMYNIAPKDGLTIASIHNAMPLHQVLDGRGVRFDAAKFSWLGSTGSENEVILAWHTAGITTIRQAMEKEIVLGSTGAGSGLSIIPTAMNNVLGTRFRLVIGYKTSEDINLALQRGEVQARAFGINSIESQHPDWLQEKKVAFLAQAGVKRDKDLPDVPLLTELAGTPEQRQVLKLISTPAGLGHPYLAPPGTPPERLALLRQAFAATLKDKAFLAEVEKLQITIDPMSADEVSAIVAETINAPSEVVAKAKAAMEAPETRPAAPQP
ncbi:MAG TPA: tripartite tricarboxylate transporter substrate-binding protein [Xanthobacteraceae bacterium]|nr:tripartite tricarboxylate transporter substrate-binding protein [Xanthobacteraceae bacterium]